MKRLAILLVALMLVVGHHANAATYTYAILEKTQTFSGLNTFTIMPILRCTNDPAGSDPCTNVGQLCATATAIYVCNGTDFDALISGGVPDIDSVTGQSSWDTAATKKTADLIIDGVEVDLEAGTAEGYLRLAQSGTPPATGCDTAAEVGRIYLDTDADTNGSVFVCVDTGSPTWKDIDDDGGAGAAISFDATNDAVNESTGITHLECDGNGMSCSEPVADEARIALNIGTGATQVSAGNHAHTYGSDTQVLYSASGTASGDAGMTYSAAGDDLTVVGTTTSGDFATSGSSAGSIVLTEDSPGSNKVTIASQASRTNDLVANFPDVSGTLEVTMLGQTIAESELASEDYGDFTCGAGADDCVLDTGAVADGELANNYSGVGACAAASGVVATVDNAAPTCDANVAFDDETNTFSVLQTFGSGAHVSTGVLSVLDGNTISFEGQAGNTTLKRDTDLAAIIATVDGTVAARFFDDQFDLPECPTDHSTIALGRLCKDTTEGLISFRDSHGSRSIPFLEDGGSGVGDVVGPESSLDSELPIFDGTTGTLLAGSGFTLNITAGDCTGDGNDGTLTVNGSNQIICSADDGGAGGFTSWFLDGDNNSPQTISDGNEALMVGGIGIDTNAAVTDQVTFTFDATEITGTTTWGGGAGQAFVWDVGATDPTFTLSSNSVVITNAATFTLAGSQVTTLATALGGDASGTIGAVVVDDVQTATANTEAADNNTTQVATTAFVQQEHADSAGSCTNQVVTAVNADAAPTCADVSSAMIGANVITAADVDASLDTVRCAHMIIPDVAITDEFVIRLPPFAGTMTRIDCEAFSGTSFTINICDGEDIGDDTCATSIPGSTMVCDTTGVNDTTLTNPGFAARDKVSLVVTAVTGSVIGDVYITCTVD